MIKKIGLFLLSATLLMGCQYWDGTRYHDDAYEEIYIPMKSYISLDDHGVIYKKENARWNKIEKTKISDEEEYSTRESGEFFLTKGVYRVCYDNKYKPNINKVIYGDTLNNSFKEAILLKGQQSYRGICIKDTENQYYKVSLEKDQKLVMTIKDIDDNKVIFKRYDSSRNLLKTYKLNKTLYNYRYDEYRSKKKETFYLENVSNSSYIFTLTIL